MQFRWDNASAIGTYFKSKTNISTFEEIRYFTLLTAIPASAFQGSTILRMTVPSNITKINQNAFRDASISFIDLPATMTTLADYAFTGSIRYIVSRATTPPSAGSAFPSVGNMVAAYVPNDSVDTYKVAGGWKKFAAKIRPLSEYVG